MWRNPRLIVLLAVGSLTTMTGGVVAPILPEIVQQLQIPPEQAGVLVSMHALTIALFSPLLGLLADKIGRLRVLVPSLLFYALSGVAGALAPNFWFLLVTRAALGAASGGIAAASLGLLGVMYEGQARSQVLGLVTSTLTIMGIIEPLLSGWIGSANWRYSFYLYGLGLPMAPLVIWIWRNEQSQKASGTAEPTINLSKVLRNSQTLKLLFGLSLTSVAMYAVVIYAPLYLKATLGVGTVFNGIVLAARALGAAIVSAFVASRLSQRFGTVRAIALGFGLMAVTLITIPLLKQLSEILLAAIIFGMGFGIVLPSLYSALANLSPTQLRSSILATGTGASFLGQFLSPILLGPIVGYAGLEAGFYAAAGVAIVAAVLILKQGLGTRG